MRSAILEEVGNLVIKDVPKPSPGHEEALIKISSAGVCHSDLHIIKGDWPLAGILDPPVPTGHEGIGVIEELGSGAENFLQIGDRVILGLGGAGGGYWCGACEECLAGRPMFCARGKMLFGTFSEYISVWAKALVKLPDEVGDSEVPLACGGLTAYSAVKKLIKFGITPGKTVAIIGAAGGLGHYAVQVAKAFGYKVIGIDIGSEKLEFVKGLGADHALEPRKASRFIERKLGGTYASIIFSPKLASFEQAYKITRRGGVFMAVAMPAMNEGTLSVIPLEFVYKGIHMMSSVTGTVEEMRELVQLAADGKVKTHVSRTLGLSEISQVLDELEQGAYTGRAIIDNILK